jgi:hypothetical protein
MLRKNTAIANAAACAWLTLPSVSPAMNWSISPRVRAFPSRLLMMTSCGRKTINPLPSVL